MKWNKITDADSAPKHGRYVLLAKYDEIFSEYFYDAGSWDNDIKRWSIDFIRATLSDFDYRLTDFDYWADIDAPEVGDEGQQSIPYLCVSANHSTNRTT